MTFPACPMIGDFLDLPSHKLAHDGVAAVVDAHSTALGDDVALLDGHANLETRLRRKLPYSGTDVSKPVADDAKGILAAITNTDRVLISTYQAGVWDWEVFKTPYHRYGATGQLGLGKLTDPMVMLDVVKSGAATTATTSSEVARFTNTGTTVDGAVVSVVSGALGKSIVQLGSPTNLSYSRFVSDSAAATLDIVHNGTIRDRMYGDGARIIMRDDNATGVTLSPPEALRLVRAPEGGSHVALGMQAGSAGFVNILAGHSGMIDHGKLRYAIGSSTWEFMANQKLSMSVAQHAVHVLGDGANGPAWLNSSQVLRVLNNGTGLSANIAIASSGTGDAGIHFGDTAALESKVVWSNADQQLELQVGTTRAIVTNVAGSVWLGPFADPGVFVNGVTGNTQIKGNLIVGTTLQVNDTTAAAGTVAVITAGGQVRQQSSSLRYKKNITPMTLNESRTIVLGFEAVWYEDNTDSGIRPGRLFPGGIAEQIEGVDARYNQHDDESVPFSQTVPKTIDYAYVVAPLAHVAQDHDLRIDDQQVALASVATVLTALEGRVAALEAPPA